MVRSEQGLAEDTRDLSSIPVLAKCAEILAPHPAVPASVGMTLATPLPDAGLRVWKALALALCLAAHTFCSQNHCILLVRCIRAGTGTGSTHQDVSGVTEGMEGMLLLSCPILPVLGTWAGHGQRQHPVLSSFSNTETYSLPSLVNSGSHPLPFSGHLLFCALRPVPGRVQSHW